MMDFNPETLLAFFSQYAYRPYYVYGFVVLFMTASSFGLPIPEELTLVTVGIVAYMAKNPVDFPPPYVGAEAVDVTTLMIVCFFAVFGSDLFVYSLGKFFGRKIIQTKFFQKQVQGKAYTTINQWFEKYGGWVCGIFRFTPGLRFPGHLSCGFWGIPLWKFALIDGIAALFTVPTQVYLAATYGEVIVDKFKEFKLILAGIFAIALVVWLVRKFITKKKTATS